jgi:sugar (pentulose or hexulose) kinase
MAQSLVAVVDVGKSLSKLSMWTETGELIAKESRVNAPVAGTAYSALDADGIERWLVETLRRLAGHGHVRALVPVAHGAAAALLRDGVLACEPIDYEAEPPASVRESYAARRDEFALTGSPALPACLNLGLQLEWLDALQPGLIGGATLVTWPQYFAWLMSGVASTEVSSLGCHTDLWQFALGRPSPLAASRGWASRFAPLRRADEVLGSVTAHWAQRTGLPRSAEVHCGVHDSNAALMAARAFIDSADADVTVLSTGTWFIAMHAANSPPDLATLREERDCLVNSDPWARPIPSARFMGGREVEVLCGLDSPRLDDASQQPALLDAARAVIEQGARAMPSFAAGGPFPRRQGRWIREPRNPVERAAAAALYLALVADTALTLVGARDRIVIEGRFAASQLFVRALASLRSGDRLYLCAQSGGLDVAFGALRLVLPEVRPRAELVPVEPLAIDLSDYAERWRSEVHSS